jgi:pantetheine-phosphate adenylyltransferase
MQYKFHHGIVGGTFDRFHRGHQALLTAAFEQSEKVTIGIATDELFHKKGLANLIEDYVIREQNIYDFVSKNGWTKRYTNIPIHDIYGNSLEEKNIDAVFVTENTGQNALKINEERKKKNMDPLEIVIVPFVLGEDNEIISSERIRRGEIDRDGNSYALLFQSKKEFHLPETVRKELQRPIGQIASSMQSVLSSLASHTMLIAVGDIVAASALKAGRTADINIIDGRTRRVALEPAYVVSFEKLSQRATRNPAGTITAQAATSLQEAMYDFETTHTEQLIVVTGEEDLLAIPAILFSPLESIILYGQFDIGIVVVKVSEQNKKRVYDLFRKFQ